MFTLPERINPKAVAKQIPTLHQSPWTFLIASVVIISATLLLHTLPKIKALESTQVMIVSEEEKSITFDEQIEKADLEREKANERLALFEERDKPRLEKIFPSEEGITEMTRFLERFSLQLQKRGAFTLNTISYGSSVNNGKYSELPIRLSFQANTENFVTFMQLVKNSGSTKEKDFYDGEPVRIMKINRINVSIPNLATTSDYEEQVYSLSVDMSTFYR
jgi:Tfp pilus assembly protein PilO